MNLFQRPFYCSLLLTGAILFFIAGCDESPTDSGNDDKDTTKQDTTDNQDTTEQNENVGRIFRVDDALNYIDPNQTDRRDTLDVTISGYDETFMDESEVYHYTMPAGFVTDRVFYGGLTTLANEDIRLYYSGNLGFGSDIWPFNGWRTYPLGSQDDIYEIIHDSVNALNNIQQTASWEAVLTVPRIIEFNNQTYTALVVEWELLVDRRNPDTQEEISFYRISGEDAYVAELGYPITRTTSTYVNGELWSEGEATLIEIIEP